MKAVVMEIKKGIAIVLDSSGRFHKIPDDGNLRIGYETTICTEGLHKGVKLSKFVSVAAAFLIAFGSFGALSYSLPYSYVEVDINPSVQFTANIYNRIIKAESFNEEGNEIISEDSFVNMTIENGLDKLLEKAVEKGYISGNAENAVLVTVASRNSKRAENISNKASGKAETELKESGVSAEVAVEQITIKQRKNIVKEDAVSPGKAALIEKLVTENPELDAEELKAASTKEIVKSIHEVRKQQQEELKQQKLEEQRRKQEEQQKKQQEKKNEGKEGPVGENGGGNIDTDAAIVLNTGSGETNGSEVVNNEGSNKNTGSDNVVGDNPDKSWKDNTYSEKVKKMPEKIKKDKMTDNINKKNYSINEKVLKNKLESGKANNRDDGNTRSDSGSKPGNENSKSGNGNSKSDNENSKSGNGKSKSGN